MFQKGANSEYRSGPIQSSEIIIPPQRAQAQIIANIGVYFRPGLARSVFAVASEAPVAKLQRAAEKQANLYAVPKANLFETPWLGDSRNPPLPSLRVCHRHCYPTYQR